MASNIIGSAGKCRCGRWRTLLLLAALLAPGCQRQAAPLVEAPALPPPRVPHPLIERDLAEIKLSGTLRVITWYGAEGYFIQDGDDAGFAFELLSVFARGQRVALEVVVPPPGDDPISLLNSGQGDVVAAGLTSDPLLEAWTAFAGFTRPCLLERLVLVVPAGETPPSQAAAALAGHIVYVPESSTAHHVLRAQWDRIGPVFRIAVASPGTSHDALIARVARGDIDATAAPRHLARALAITIPGARLGAELSGNLPRVWLVRQNSPRLLAELDLFLKGHFEVREDGLHRSPLYVTLWHRYYQDPHQIRRLHHPEGRPDLGGRISRWDDVFRQASDSTGIDWRLLAAIAHRESRFDPAAVSPSGAVGLMQIMPEAGGPDFTQLADPLANVLAGARRLRQIHDTYARLDRRDRWAMAIATYHAGEGRLEDARRVAADAGRNPDRWDEHVAVGLTLLEHHGETPYLRWAGYPGGQTVRYVRLVLDRYRHYARLTGSLDPLPPEPARPALAAGAVSLTPGSPPALAADAVRPAGRARDASGG